MLQLQHIGWSFLSLFYLPPGYEDTNNDILSFIPIITVINAVSPSSFSITSFTWGDSIRVYP